jgi:hypothetical protein
MGLLLRRLRKRRFGNVQLPPPHRPGDGLHVLHRYPHYVVVCLLLVAGVVLLLSAIREVSTSRLAAKDNV